MAHANVVTKAMILSAGLGTRLRPVTDLYAKPAVPFLNIPLLYYPVYLAELAGVRSLVMNTHYKSEQIEQLAGSLGRMGFETQLSHEPGEPLGSGGGIWKAREHLKTSNFLVANGDEVILPRDPEILQRFTREHSQHRSLATILVMKHPLVGSQFGGVWAEPDGKILGFGKDGSKFGTKVTGYHYIGLLLLSERIFEYLPEGESNILYDALAAAIAKGESVRVVVGDFTWFETGNPKDFLHATGEALELLHTGKGHDAEVLHNFTQRFWSPGTKLELKNQALVLTDPTSSIESGAQVKGFAVIGANTKISAGAVVENSVVLPQSTVPSTEAISNTIALPRK